MSFNKITIIGNLGADPELRYSPQGDAVCKLSIATTDKKQGAQVTWFRVTLWRRMAENAAKYLVKGNPVYIEGKLKVEEWKDRDGKNRFTLEVTATDMQFIAYQEMERNVDKEELITSSKGIQRNENSIPDDSDIPW